MMLGILVFRATKAQFGEDYYTEKKQRKTEEREFRVDLLGDSAAKPMDKTSVEYITFLLAVGTCPSPAGARSPVSRLASHFVLEVVSGRPNTRA